MVCIRLATWNVIHCDKGRLLPWLDSRALDVLCLQETKLPADAFHELVRPALAHHGEGRWNGVAIASRVG